MKLRESNLHKLGQRKFDVLIITKLDDFVRRRSKIAFIARKHEIRDAPGLFEACRILFGDEAEAKFFEYFEERPSRDVMRASERPLSVWE